MARTKEFDEEVVLDKALHLFRARGYQQTSFADLTDHLGVSRQSLYDTYGDKHALYEAALKRYLARGLDYVRRVFGSEQSLEKTLTEFFDGIIEGQCAGGSYGCLLVNSMVELAPHDPTTRAYFAGHCHAVESIFIQRLIRAQRDGELAKDQDPVALAKYLNHVLMGLSVGVRSAASPADLRRTVALSLRAFG